MLAWNQLVPYIPLPHHCTIDTIRMYVGTYFAEGSVQYDSMLGDILDARKQLNDVRQYPIALSMLMLMGTKPE